MKNVRLTKLIAPAIAFVLGLIMTTYVNGQCSSHGIASYSPSPIQTVYRGQQYAPVQSYVAPRQHVAASSYYSGASNAYRAPATRFQSNYQYSPAPSYTQNYVGNNYGIGNSYPSTSVVNNPSANYQSYSSQSIGYRAPASQGGSCASGSCPLK